MTQPSSREIDLMGRIAAGDGEALAEAFDLHAPVVLGLLVRLLGRRNEAEEILQEAFLQVWMQAGSFDPQRATPRGWILKIARSRALDRLRNRGLST
jgi:RNA polymerase sigma-70 factor, ECF subfamily